MNPGFLSFGPAAVDWKKTGRVDYADARPLSIPELNRPMKSENVGPEVDEAGELSPESLASPMPLSQALGIILRERWRGALKYLPKVAENPADVDFVHKLRVASRRLSTVLDVLGPGFPDKPATRLFKLAQRTRRRCGTARDLDVRRKFFESLMPHAPAADLGVIERLCRKTDRDRRRVQKKLRRKLPGLEQRLRSAGAELLEALAKEQRPDEDPAATFGQTGVRTLLQELSLLWSRAADDLAAGEPFHQLRIACKHLRYTLEVFLPALPESFREEFHPQLEHIQDLLGEINDAAHGTRALKRQRKKWKRACENAPRKHQKLAALGWARLRAGIDTVLAAYTQQAEQAKTEFLDLWPGFAGDSFRLPVEDALLALLDEPTALTTPETRQAAAAGADGANPAAAAAPHAGEGAPFAATWQAARRGAP